MIITIQSTEKIVTVDGVSARIWEGKTAGGIAVIAFITRIAVSEQEDPTEFERELQQHAAPSAEAQAFPLRLILGEEQKPVPVKPCPRCGTPMQVLLFLGVRPEFYVCPQCAIAFDLETLEPLATVIGR